MDILNQSSKILQVGAYLVCTPSQPFLASGCLEDICMQSSKTRCLMTDHSDLHEGDNPVAAGGLNLTLRLHRLHRH